MSTTFRLAATLCCGRYHRARPRFATAHLETNLVPKFHLGTPLANREVSLRANRSRFIPPHITL